MRQSVYTLCIICISSALFAACVPKVTKSFPDKRNYVVDVERTSGPAEATIGDSLLVRPFTISPGYDSRQFVIRTGENEYETLYYDQFFARPERLFHAETKDWLAQSGLFVNILGNSSLVMAGHALEGSVVRVYGDFRDEKKAVLEMQFTLLRLSENGPEILMQRTYQTEQKIENENPKTLVAGWERGLASLLEELENELKEIQ